MNTRIYYWRGMSVWSDDLNDMDILTETACKLLHQLKSIYHTDAAVIKALQNISERDSMSTDHEYSCYLKIDLRALEIMEYNAGLHRSV